MDKQTQQAFALGGLNDEGGEIDEASGNRVPIGGTKEGVRDDIEINISEGEFVFPADVVRYHGLDKMMALRQEAKMGLKQMERMGQMGNSEEASMPDDLPFEMADLIVVGGKGEPMKFANGGFVPQMQTLQTAPVPTIGGGTSTGTQTPIVYDDFMKTPVVTMQEYRDANGNSIIITSVNGVATTEIPAGYTLYTPPANTAPTTTQAAIQTVNSRSYRPSGDNEGPEPQPDQPAPNYRNMNDNEFFSYMAEQNSFGAKAGNAAGLAIATMVGGPVGLLVSALMRNNKNNQMANMKSRIDRMDDGPAKTNALALYKEYGGETDPKKKEGLFANITNFVTGLVTPVANALGINQEDAAKVAQNAAVTEVSGTAAYDEKVKQARANIISPAQSVTPLVQAEDVVSPALPTGIGGLTNQVDAPGAAFNFSSGPAGTVGYNTGQVDPRLAKAAAKDPRLTAIENQELAIIEAEKTDLPTDTLASQQNRADTALKIAQINEQEAKERLNAFNRQQLIDRNEDQGQPTNQVQQQMDAMRNQASTFAPAETVPQQSASDRLTSRITSADAGDNFVGGDFQTAGILGDTIGAINKFGADNLGGIDPSQSKDSVVKQLQDNVTAVTPSFTQTPVAPTSETRRQDSQTNLSVPTVTQQNVVPSNQQSLYTGEQAQADELREQSLTMPSDPRDSIPTGIGGYTDATSFDRQAGARNLTGTGVDAQMTAAIPPQQGLISKQMEGMGSPLSPVTSPIGLNVEPRARSMYEYPVQETAPKETPAQARAREAAAQRARIQTRNKEIAAATSKIPARILNSKQTQDAIKAGYTGSTTGGYAIGKISGSNGNEAGVVQRADGKVTKVRDLEGYEGLKGTQRGAMTVFSDAEGTKFVKSTFGKKTKLNGDKYEGPGITRKDKGLGNTFFQSAANVITPGDGKSYVDGELVSDSSSGSSSTKTYSSLAEAAKDGQHGQSVNIAGKGVQKVAFGDASYDAKMKAESDKADDGGSDDSKIVCTEMYRQTQLVDWQHTMKIWHVYQKKYLTPYHQIGYHWLFKPYVKGMKKSSILTKLGATLAKHRTEHLRYVLTKGKSKDNLVGNVWCKFVHPLVYVAGIFKQKIGK